MGTEGAGIPAKASLTESRGAKLRKSKSPRPRAFTRSFAVTYSSPSASMRTPPWECERPTKKTTGGRLGRLLCLDSRHIGKSCSYSRSRSRNGQGRAPRWECPPWLYGSGGRGVGVDHSLPHGQGLPKGKTLFTKGLAGFGEISHYPLCTPAIGASRAVHGS